VEAVKVDKQQFDALMAKLIATPASAKEGIKKPRKARPKARPSRSVLRT
jgi:hypothetical protein